MRSIPTIMFATAMACLVLSAPARADDRGRALFEIGVQIGLAERGAVTGAEPAQLVEHLRFARRLAEESGALPIGEIDALIERVGKADDSRDVQPAVALLRQRLAHGLRGRSTAVECPTPPPVEPKPDVALPEEDLPPAEPAVRVEPGDWVGTWDTNWGDMTLTISKEGLISGHYGSSRHEVWGRVKADDPSTFCGAWRHHNSSSTGRFTFRIVKPCVFEGTWTWGRAEPNLESPNWRGTMRRHEESPTDPPATEALLPASEG